MIDLPLAKPSPEPPQHIAYWPYCEHCQEAFEFDQEGPFAYCGCGTTEWGNPRPFPWVPNPRLAQLPAGWKAMPPQLTDVQLDSAMRAHEGRMYPADMYHGPRSMRRVEYAAVFKAAPLPGDPALGEHIDLDKVAWAMIQAAADVGYQTWMPKEYTANDWQSDVCAFLRTGTLGDLPPVHPIAPREELVELVRFLRSACAVEAVFSAAAGQHDVDRLRRAGDLLDRMLDVPELIATITATADRWDAIAERHGVRQFTGNDHRLMANELRAAIAGFVRAQRLAKVQDGSG